MVGLKDIKKLLSVVMLTVCAVAVCTVFLNFRFDLIAEFDTISDPSLQGLFDAQISMSGVIIACAGGVLGAVTLIVLLFSIHRFIAENSANMGVLKAMGYAGTRISFGFSKFGLSVLVGAVIGYLGGFLLSLLIYKSLSSDLVDNLQFGFHFETILALVIIPFIVFTVISVLFAMLKLRKSPLDLIHGHRKEKTNSIIKKMQQKSKEMPFLTRIRRTMLFHNLLLIFFVGFAAFGFSAQVQMAFTMPEITPDYTMSVMLLVIGFILGAVTLLLSFSFLFNANNKYLALLKAYGYTDKECSSAIFGGFRIVSYVGFAIGTGYQFMLIKMVVAIFASSYEIPEINFNFIGLAITLAIFVALYELMMLFYKRKVNSVPLKQIMSE